METPEHFFIKGRELLAEPYHFKAVGLPNIYLQNGVTIENDEGYGEIVTIENIDGLCRAIGMHIIEKPTPLGGAEFRYLRKQMELTQAELADLMRVEPQTVANYEKGRGIPGLSDEFMRITYWTHLLPEDARAALVKAFMNATSHQDRVPPVTRNRLSQGWRECAMAA